MGIARALGIEALAARPLVYANPLTFVKAYLGLTGALPFWEELSM